MLDVGPQAFDDHVLDLPLFAFALDKAPSAEARAPRRASVSRRSSVRSTFEVVPVARHTALAAYVGSGAASPTDAAATLTSTRPWASRRRRRRNEGMAVDEQVKQPEEHGRRRTPRRPRADVVAGWLEQQRRLDEIVNPPVLRLLAEQQAWLKAASGAAAMPTGVTKLFTAGDLALARGVVADYERTRRLLGGLNPAADAARQLRALGATGSWPALQEANLAHERVARLIAPLDVAAVRDLAGVSTAVASVAAMIRPPALNFASDISAIATSAVASWRNYVDALPAALDVADLFHVEAAGRSVLGVTAASAVLLGDDDAVDVVEEWELAPAQTRERMRERLRAIDARLVVRLDGAWNAVAHAGPDAVSQAANSAIELIDWTLRLTCDETEFEAWVAAQVKPGDYRDRNGRPTRQAKIRYLLRGRAYEADLVDATTQSLIAVHRGLQKLKHTRGEHDVDAVARLLPSVEAVLFLIVDD